MFENIEWVFFDIGSTIIDEHIAYEASTPTHRTITPAPLTVRIAVSS